VIAGGGDYANVARLSLPFKRSKVLVFLGISTKFSMGSHLSFADGLVFGRRGVGDDESGEVFDTLVQAILTFGANLEMRKCQNIAVLSCIFGSNQQKRSWVGCQRRCILLFLVIGTDFPRHPFYILQPL